MIPHMNELLVFFESEQKKKFFFEEKNSKWPSQKKINVECYISQDLIQT